MGQKILVIEDEQGLRELIALELKASGYEVFLAPDGQSGLQMAYKIKPDLIITDVLMPKMDGNQLIKHLRASDFGKNIPFIVLSARCKMKEYFEAVHVDEFVAKPFEAEDLLKKVAHVLDKSRFLTAKPSSPARSSPVALKRVLIFEDDPWVFNNLQTTFEEYGYQVKVTHSAAECLEAAVLFVPQMILAKFTIEGMSAGKLVELLRGMSHLKECPILVYSNEEIGEERNNILRLGATDFLADFRGIKLLKWVNEFFHT